MGRPVTHFQILAKRPDEAARFYAELFGWSVNADNPLGYRVIDTGSKTGVQGGIWPSPPEGHAFVQLFVEVEDITARVAKVTELGGRVVVPPQKLPGGETMSVILDREGIPFGLMEPARAK